MKLHHTLAAITLTLLASVASALEIKAYTPESFASLQAAKQPVVLHFHADWCPVCKAQAKVFEGWQGDASVPGTLLRVNYDQEKELRRSMGVRSQSTVIAFKGSAEKARLAGETDAAALRAVLAAAVN